MDERVVRDAVDEDEDFRDLGVADDDSVRTDPELEREMFKALGMRAISIRLPNGLIDAFKAVANLHGVGYQPLMRDVLERWLLGELRHLAQQQSAELTAAKKEAYEARSTAGDDPSPLAKAA